MKEFVKYIYSFEFLIIFYLTIFQINPNHNYYSNEFQINKNSTFTNI